MKKASSQDYKGRFNEIMMDPCNKFIPRIQGAGSVENDIIIMHNGIKIHMGNLAYYDDFAEILKINKGLHEPQEEYVFAEVLKYIQGDSTMIELGAYWGFYSLWFQSKINGANNYLIEPNPHNLMCGKENFRINNMHGNFTEGKIGKDGLDLKQFITQNSIKKINLLHADIQGAELEMLIEIKPLLKERLVDYIFVSTHSQSLHYSCIDELVHANYTIIASADFDNETYCFDGVLVAKREELQHPSFIKLPLRDPKEVTSKMYIDNKNQN